MRVLPYISLPLGVSPRILGGMFEQRLFSFDSLSASIAVDGFILPYLLVSIVKVFSVCLILFAGTVATYGSIWAMLVARVIHIFTTP